jgi:hypothetical protein
MWPNDPPPAPTSSAPIRIRLGRGQRLEMPAGTVRVDRVTQYGNPFRIGEPVDMQLAKRWGWKIEDPARRCRDAKEAADLFARALATDEANKAVLRNVLRGKNLACWCSLHQPCHADILLQVANA